LTILLFGATGSAGGSVLDVCLADDQVREVRVLARRPAPLAHDKLRWIICSDFSSYEGLERAFANVDACLFCLGKSATQVATEREYRLITIDYAMAAAHTLRQASPSAVFHYVSGSGAGLDSRFMWARVKAEAERELMVAIVAVCWRPAAIDGKPSTSEPALYRLVRPLYRLFRGFRRFYVSGEDIGLAMLEATDEGIRHRIIENAELRDFADRRRARRSARSH
jgi:uncharacterized protein YbjT (DUF2867 family)